jgi:hypothetical protein
VRSIDCVERILNEECKWKDVTPETRFLSFDGIKDGLLFICRNIKGIVFFGKVLTYYSNDITICCFGPPFFYRVCQRKSIHSEKYLKNENYAIFRISLHAYW